MSLCECMGVRENGCNIVKWVTTKVEKLYKLKPFTILHLFYQECTRLPKEAFFLSVLTPLKSVRLDNKSNSAMR